MSVTLRSIIIAGCLMIAATLLYRYSSIQGQLSTEEIQARFPTFQALNFSGQIFDNNGTIKYSINADEVVYYQDKGLVEMVKPVGRYFDHSSPRILYNPDTKNLSQANTDGKQTEISIKIQGSALEEYKDVNSLIKISPVPENLKLAFVPFNYWTIKAEQGYMIHNEIAVLDGQITVVPSDESNIIKRISTPHLQLDMAANTISSKRQIVIEGQQFIDQGRDYIIDLNAKTFVIKEKPHAVYYP